MNVVRIPFDYATKNEAVPRDPVVEVAIQGRKTLFLLDTGSNAHAVDSGFARQLGLVGRNEGAGSDHFGRPLATAELPDVPAVIGSWPASLKGGFAIASEKSLLRDGILGTISPQCLVDSGATVLDLPAKRLLIVPLDSGELREWLAAEFPRTEFVELARRGEDPCEMLVTASLDGRPETPVVLDSGSGHTEFGDAYSGLTAGLHRSPTTLRIGGRLLPVPEIEVRSFKNQPQQNGTLGLDAIRGLVLVFPAGRSKVWLGFPSRGLRRKKGRRL